MRVRPDDKQEMLDAYPSAFLDIGVMIEHAPSPVETARVET